MAPASGTRIGSYEVLSLLGEGGMGQVYRARDTKLNRDVALKILPEGFALDSDRIARFRREAQVLASLNHPNIAHIYGFEDSGTTHALVLELVEGPTLADRIAKGAIPLDEALPIAKQIAEALEAAHEQGIIHRDLKPANIKVRDDATVKVLDFGLAKALEPASAIGPLLTNSPTITTPAQMTGVGMILGTAAYMSPEQAKGRPADKRSDVWAFGCVLYEMLTGKRAFEGEDVSDTLAAVLRAEPDWNVLPHSASPQVRLLVQRCLRKDRRERLGDVAAVRLLLEPTETVTSLIEASSRQTRSVLSRILLSGMVLAGMLLLVAAGWLLKPSPAVSPIARFDVFLPAGQRYSGNTSSPIVVSPDGTRIAYLASGSVFVRTLSDVEPRLITGPRDFGTAFLTAPTFSPDGGSLAFTFASGSERGIKRVDISGGAAVTVTSSSNPEIAAAVLGRLNWSDGAFLYSDPVKGIMRVPDVGGQSEQLIAVTGDELLASPQFLPDKRTLLFTVAHGTGRDRWDKAQVVAQVPGTKERKVLVDGLDGQYLPTGHLVYVVGGVLFATRFDVKRLQLGAERVPVVQGVRRVLDTSTPALAVSAAGMLAYIPGPSSGNLSNFQLALIDRSARPVPLKLPAGSYAFPRVSPDGKLIAFVTDDGKESIVWTYELAGATTMRRLTFGGNNRYPIWSRDSQHVAFQSDRDGDLGIFWQRPDGTPERLTKADKGESHIPQSWFPNADRFLYSVNKGAKYSLWVYDIQARKATPFGDLTSTTPFAARVSPDGRWVAYGYRESSTLNSLYVQPFPPTGARYLVSAKDDDGHFPVWSTDGKQIFYSAAGQFSVVNISTAPVFAASAPELLPRTFIENGPTTEATYDIAPDGKEFVGTIQQFENGVDRAVMRVVLNWFEELKQRVPVK